MRKRITYISLFFLFSVSAALSQDRVQLFADVKDNDTLQKLITEFSVQLKKSQVKNPKKSQKILPKTSQNK